MTQDKSASRGGQGTSTSGTQSTTGMGTGTPNDMAAQAKETARQAAGQAREQARELTQQAREQAGARVATQKDRVADSLGGVASMLRQTGDQMRDQDQMGLTGFVDQAASRVENFSSYLRENDMGRLMYDVERFARREPAIFLGGAFLLGLLGARFVKSSRPQPQYDERYYGSSRYYENQYRPYYSGYAEGPGSSGGAGSTGGYTTGTGTAGMGYTGTGGTSSTSGTGYTGGTGTGYTGTTGTSSTSTGAGNDSSRQGGQRGAGIYDNDREGS